jgi:hypothetical protein
VLSVPTERVWLTAVAAELARISPSLRLLRCFAAADSDFDARTTW